jgi:hypothetical protein
MKNQYRKASDIVNQFFSGISVSDIDDANQVIDIWKKTVGEKIAAHSRILDVEKGSLIVEVDHSGWSQQIIFKKKSIVWAFSQSFPQFGINTIQIRVISECITPYVKEENHIGQGVYRVEEEAIESKCSDDLTTILSKLKESIQRGKPK